MKKLFVLLLMCPFVAVFGQQIAEVSPKWRLNLAGGASYMTASTKDAENAMIDWGFTRPTAEDYINGLRWSWQGNADIHYLLNRCIGIGLKYSFFKTKGDITENYILNTPPMAGYSKYFIAQTEEVMHVNYIGPSLYAQKFIDSNDKWKITGLLSVGYVHYKNEGEVKKGLVTISYFRPLNETELNGSDISHQVISASVTSNTIGMTAGLGIEYLINQHLGVGFDLSYMGASFSEMKDAKSKKTIKLDKSENVSRLDASLGLRVYF